MTSSKSNEQSKRFIEAARQIGADDDSAAFRERLKMLVKAPQPKDAQKRKSEHDSDCSAHNGPAYQAGPCDCSLSKPRR